MPVFDGTPGNDTLAGANGADTLNGFAGADSLSGLNGSDVINAGDGNDSAFGGSGNDTLSGDNDDDLLDGGSNNDQLFGGNGNDTLTGGSGNDILDGGAGIDTLDYSLSSAVAIDIGLNTTGGDANGDTISLFENVVGGGGNDTLTGSFAANVLTGNAGNDSLTGDAGNDSLFGGTGTDALFGGADNDLLQGGASGDTISGGAGIDTADYSTSDAGVSVNLQNNVVSGGHAASDVLSGIENVTGSAFNDTLTGDNGQSVLSGGAGADSLDGRNGDDLLSGGSGNDTVAGGLGNDTLAGEDGADRIFAGGGNDSISGGTGDDTLFGDSDQPSSWSYRFYDRDFNTSNGQAFQIETGTLRTEGTTTDFDLRTLAAVARPPATIATNPSDFGIILTSTYTANTAGVYRFDTTSDDGSTLRILDTNGNPLTFTNQNGATGLFMDNDFHQAATTRYGDVALAAGQSYTIEIRFWENAGEEVLSATVTPPGGGIQNLIGNAGIGSAVNTGNDTILAGDGNDVIFGEAGNDSLSGEAGNDNIDGGTGNDTILGSVGTDTVFGGLGDDSIEGGDDADLIYGDTIVPDLLSNHADTIFGGAGNDTIYGGNGNDLIFGLAGDDSLYGDNGNDTLEGGADNDRLLGGNGSDVLFGGDGNDTAFGGNSADNIEGGIGTDSLSGDDGNDTISGGAGADAQFGGADRDQFFVAVAGDGFGDAIDGGEAGDDFDRLDLTGTGKPRILYSTSNRENGTVEFLDANRAVIGTLTFTNIEDVIPCFTPGTLIGTPRGSIRVEALRVGDLVLTRDGGAQPLRWIGTRWLSAAALAAQPTLVPVRIAAGALGAGLPERDLLVSPQHRVLVSGPRTELCFGDDEVLVAAIHLVGLPGITRAGGAGVQYLHLMFDRHEIIRSDGAWTESFQPGCRTLGGMDKAQRAEIAALFPDLEHHGARFAAARRSLKAHEARVLFAA